MATYLHMGMQSQAREGCDLEVDGQNLYRIPVARTSMQQKEGLRNRQDVSGMLFEPGPTALTMSGVLNPLEAVLLRPEGVGLVVMEKIRLEPGKASYDLSKWRGASVLELLNADKFQVGSSVKLKDCRTW